METIRPYGLNLLQQVDFTINRNLLERSLSNVMIVKQADIFIMGECILLRSNNELELLMIAYI
jgi:hypothetical protein